MVNSNQLMELRPRPHSPQLHKQFKPSLPPIKIIAKTQIQKLKKKTQIKNTKTKVKKIKGRKKNRYRTNQTQYPTINYAL